MGMYLGDRAAVEGGVRELLRSKGLEETAGMPARTDRAHSSSLSCYWGFQEKREKGFLESW